MIIASSHVGASTVMAHEIAELKGKDCDLIVVGANDAKQTIEELSMKKIIISAAPKINEAVVAAPFVSGGMSKRAKRRKAERDAKKKRR